MAVAKTAEIMSGSVESIEAAVRDGVAKAAETIQGIRGAWVKGTKAILREDTITRSV